MPVEGTYVTVEEAAEMLGIKPTSVRDAITTGRMAAVKVGTHAVKRGDKEHTRGRIDLIEVAEVERYRRENLGGRSWAKRREPGYQPSKAAQYARAYRERKRARQQEAETPAPTPAEEMKQ